MPDIEDTCADSVGPASCQWTVADEPPCSREWESVVYDLRVCRVHAAMAMTIHDTVLAEKEGREAMVGHRPRRYKAPTP